MRLVAAALFSYVYSLLRQCVHLLGEGYTAQPQFE